MPNILITEPECLKRQVWKGSSSEDSAEFVALVLKFLSGLTESVGYKTGPYIMSGSSWYFPGGPVPGRGCQQTTYAPFFAEHFPSSFFSVWISGTEKMI